MKGCADNSHSEKQLAQPVGAIPGQWVFSWSSDEPSERVHPAHVPSAKESVMGWEVQLGWLWQQGYEQAQQVCPLV